MHALPLPPLLLSLSGLHSPKLLSVTTVSSPSEIERAAAGEPRAVSALVNRHSSRVLALATRMLGDRSAAEDVTQEAFLRLWKALPSWEPRAKLSTWLHRVTLNLCYDRLRKKRETLMAEPPERVDTSLRPDQALDQKQRLSAVSLAISKLPERQAAALALCAFEGRTNIEAAEIMQVSVEALESLLARGRRTLRATLKDEDDG